MSGELIHSLEGSQYKINRRGGACIQRHVLRHVLIVKRVEVVCRKNLAAGL